LADSALAYLAECEGIDKVFTLDRRDFPVYRLAGGRSLALIPPG
jgi:predicted nucleic acid-binding protein